MGASASRTLPTICVHRCSVSQLSRQASYGSGGQVSADMGDGPCGDDELHSRRRRRYHAAPADSRQPEVRMAELDVGLPLVGGPTLCIDLAGFRLLTDPTFDPPGRYEGPVPLEKRTGPALSPDEVGPIDAVLLSHDQHFDNLDRAGRGFL